MSAMDFKLGDMVKWRSKAGGTWTEKVGKIVYVLQPHQNQIRIWHDHFIGHRRMYNGLRPPGPRKHSYLVEVLDGKNRMPKLYMPRPASLQLLVPAVEPLMTARGGRKLVPLEGALELEPSIEDYERLIIKWANERGLLEGTTPEKQTLKLMEEAGELCKGMMLEDRDLIRDGIGDMLVVMANLCNKLDMSLRECIAAAYEEIRDRKGKMINGTFCKYEEVKE